MKNELSNKKTLSLFCPNKKSPLSYTELLVFCHRADQHRYDTVPSCRRAAKATGLREQTVSNSTQRLREHGLLSEDDTVISPCRHLDWFQPLDSLKERFPEGPEFRWLQNWKTLIRTPGDNILSTPCVMVYSLIRHSVEQKWKPAQGWTQEYLALMTATNPKTVGAALDTLEENGFLKVLDGMRFQLFRLRESQAACFSDKQAWSGNSSEPDEFLDDFGPGSDRLDERHKAKADLEDYMVRWPIQMKYKEAIVKAVMKEDGWEQSWQEWAFELIEKYMNM